MIQGMLGASSRGIVVLMVKDFAWLVLFGFLFAVPVAYLGIERWLQDYAYRIEPGVAVFLLAGLSTLTVTC